MCQNYPVSLSDAVQGLVARFRRKIAALEEEVRPCSIAVMPRWVLTRVACVAGQLKVSRNESGQAGEIRSEAGSWRREQGPLGLVAHTLFRRWGAVAESLRNLVHELRGDVLQLKEEKGSAEMQTDKLAIVLANYKTRFQDLLEARNKLNVEMIESEVCGGADACTDGTPQLNPFLLARLLHGRKSALR